MSERRRGITSLAIALLVSFLGCGEGKPAQEQLTGLHPVKGKINSTVGSVAGMTIYFFANGTGARSSKGEVKADNTFELYTRTPGDGATDGDYLIYFSKSMEGGKSTGKLPPKFLSPDTTNVKATIRPDTTDLGTIVITR